MKLRWRSAAFLALPFVIVAVVSRAVVPALGDTLARVAHKIAVIVTLKPPQRLPAVSASPSTVPDPNAAASANAVAAASDAGADGNAAPSGKRAKASSAPAVVAAAPAPPPGPLRIPAAKVQRAIDDAGRTIRARTTYGDDGKPMGARVTGVNGAGLGLKDGDIIVAVDGKPTMDDDAATDAALSVVARGDSILHARMTRDGAPFDVTLELPLAPSDGGKDVR